MHPSRGDERLRLFLNAVEMQNCHFIYRLCGPDKLTFSRDLNATENNFMLNFLPWKSKLIVQNLQVQDLLRLCLNFGTILLQDSVDSEILTGICRFNNFVHSVRLE